MQVGNNPLSWGWYSKQGVQRKENRDSAGIFYNGIATFAVVMDASEKGKKGKEFNALWIKLLFESLCCYGSKISKDSILVEMQKAQAKLRPPDFLLETACFCALLIRHDIECAWVFSCGDCRVGIGHDTGSIEWISGVHSIVNIFSDSFTVEHARSAERHTVTRCLKVKRFDIPDVLEVFCNQETKFFLATDGYWIDKYIGRAHEEPSEDDSSLLNIGGSPGQVCESDSDNLYIKIDLII